ncbi:hypothetical protein BOSEA31B_12879 [Hyphomicrobiales bacterium]|nr:hypothetical protein BOSEA31B_12879 [Hyphomicrobiales bacterium]CAH1698653.1 hypothetical protein BOSEA1005_11706 [Hyphomicrobiales bacterium]CAI0342298.1 hypothetical protein BO1005MUT1_180077 [Hyphomicrobiales bacterium]
MERVDMAQHQGFARILEGWRTQSLTYDNAPLGTVIGKSKPFSFASRGFGSSGEHARTSLSDRRSGHGHDPLKAPAERERLAYIVAALWRQGEQRDIPAKAANQFETTAPLPPPLGAASDEPSA